jgi:biotin-dependent carboxylase-like uncharacterized protein
MALLVVHPGISTTVQDLGRPGYRAWGVRIGGAFDRYSSALANALLGNDSACAVLEFTLIGGTYEALTPLGLSLAGAPLEATRLKRNGEKQPIRIPSAFSIKQGERLIVGGTSRGARAYLGVLGGWQTPVELGSRSSEERIRGGEQLACFSGMTPERHVEDVVPGFRDNAMRVILGPDADLLGDPATKLERPFRVSPRSDRMALRLEGDTLSVQSDPSRESAPIAPGAIQATGDSPLLLGVACGTMGGYPHVAHVISADLDRLGQQKPGDRIQFRIIDIGEARRLDQELRAEQSGRLKRVATAASDGLAWL